MFFFIYSFIQMVTEYLLRVKHPQGIGNIEAKKKDSTCSHEIDILVEDMPSTNAKQVHVTSSENEVPGQEISLLCSPELQPDQRRSQKSTVEESWQRQRLCVWSGKVTCPGPTGGIKEVHDSCSKDS